MRRLATIALVATGTASGLLYWLHDGDLRAAVDPVMPDWSTWSDRVTQAVVSERSSEPAGPPPTLEAAVGGPLEAPGVTSPEEGERP